MTRETWGLVQDDLKKLLGTNTYVNWIEPLEFEGFEDGTVRFGVPTSFLGTWVSRNFEDQIKKHLAKFGAEVLRVEYCVASNRGEAPSGGPVPAEPISAALEARAGDEASDKLLGAPLDKRYTFDRFVVGKPNELAHAAARRVAAQTTVTFNPLFLYGGVGLGKTHLMHAIALELRIKRPELKVLYLSAEQFMYRFVQALRENGTMQFKELFRSVDILMVDDVQFIAGKDSTQEEFFHTFQSSRGSAKANYHFG